MRAEPRSRPATAVGAAVTTSELVVRFRTASSALAELVLPPLTVDAGTAVAVMGPSGCGKSTLLALVAGLDVPVSGRITVGGTAVSALPGRDRVRFRRRCLGLVHQADNLLPHLTVEENIALAATIAGRDGDHPRTLIERLGLSGLDRRFPDQLSGGQRQRVAVARAVAGRPPVILADEPTGALDDANAGAVIDLLLDARRRLGATLVLVTHDPAVAARLDRVEHLAGTGHRPEVAHVG